MNLYEYHTAVHYAVTTYFMRSQQITKNTKGKGKGMKESDEKSLEFPQPDGWNLDPPMEGGAL